MIKKWLIWVSNTRSTKYARIAREVLKNHTEEECILEFEKIFSVKQKEVEKNYIVLSEKLSKYNINYITIFDEGYPESLIQLFDFPLVLYFLGDKKRFEDTRKISIIGTRKPSKDGILMAESFINALSSFRYTVVSGLAFGIDYLVHKHALEKFMPCIGVIASGLDKITPASSVKLAENIIEQNGLIISEYPLGGVKHAYDFVIRNRIISGLSSDLFVIEAGEKSGSITTARHALEQSKNIYAMPGSITNPVACGCNKLIKEGAIPITTPKDFLPTLEEKVTQKDTTAIIKDPLLDYIAKNKIATIDDLMEIFSENYQIITSKLMNFVLDGSIKLEGDQAIFTKTL